MEDELHASVFAYFFVMAQRERLEGIRSFLGAQHPCLLVEALKPKAVLVDMCAKGKLPFGCHFFKVLVPGFKQALRLPPMVSKMLNNGEIPEAAILVSRRGSWRVGVGQCSKGRSLTFNGEGWDRFIQNHDLSVGDFLVFEHNGNMHFSTLVFDPTYCEKEFPITSENVKDKGPDDHNHGVVKGKKDEAATASSYQHKAAHFQVKLHPYSVEHPYPFLYLPTEFVISNEMSYKTTATLVDPSGRAWQVTLNQYHNGKIYRKVMGKGWNKFVKANKLKVGDVCVFKLNHSLEERYKNIVMNVQFL